MHQMNRLAALTLLLGLAITPATSLQATVEKLGTDRLLLTGSVNKSDTTRIAQLLAEDTHEITTLVVCARGVGTTAWETVHELSRLLEAQEINVDLLYAENAAIAIHGFKTTYRKGKQIAWKPVDVSRNTTINVNIREFTSTNGTTAVTTRTVKESLSPTVDQFDLICRARIPKEASDVGSSAATVVGKKDSFTNRQGLADEPNQYWYYTSTNGTGSWRHATSPDIVRAVERERDWAERKLTSLRRKANRPQRAAKPAK